MKYALTNYLLLNYINNKSTRPLLNNKDLEVIRS